MSVEKSDENVADEILNSIQKEMEAHSNLGAWLLYLAKQKRSVQHRVLDTLNPKTTGRPRNPMSDEEWLSGVESWRKRGIQHKPDATDLEVIEDWIKSTGTRYKRPEGKSFHPTSPSGKAEIRGIRDACVRARRRNNYPD